ncbi:MAG: hypothetical protein HND58_08635 [Planctomycetota bacterium]|nr:MAG: hypothetical protein HND58_08635 [Planctomycetota bacterium]
MHAEAPARLARPTPAALLLLSAGMSAAVLSGCHSHSAAFEPAPQPVVEPAEPARLTAELSLFGDDDIAWASPDSLPADPIPMTASPDSADVSRVTTAEQGADFDPTISADGRYMVFASTQHSLNADIYIKRTGSKVITQLTNDPGRDVMPSISPDGAWIAFASDRVSNWNIYVMPVTGGRPVQITSGPNAELHPSWSPDGTRLAFSKLGSSSGKWEIWVTEVSNTATPHFIGYGLFPEWCPKPGTGPTGGDLLLYQRSAERGDRAFGIWTLEYKDGDVGSPSQMAGSATTAYINPTWSPDGAYIVFASVEQPGAVQSINSLRFGDSDLWMMSADGSTRVSLTTGGASDLMPAWGSDGKIYFVSTRTGNDNIWSIDAGEAMYAAGLSPSLPYANVPTGE